MSGLKRKLEQVEGKLSSEIERLKTCISDYRVRIETLNHHLTQTERERSMLEIDVKNLNRKDELLAEDSCKLKEEVGILTTVKP